MDIIIAYNLRRSKNFFENNQEIYDEKVIIKHVRYVKQVFMELVVLGCIKKDIKIFVDNIIIMKIVKAYKTIILYMQALILDFNKKLSQITQKWDYLTIN